MGGSVVFSGGKGRMMMVMGDAVCSIYILELLTYIILERFDMVCSKTRSRDEVRTDCESEIILCAGVYLQESTLSKSII